jgi:glycosyltransferase involved in cell wall biosynthesis
MKVLIVAEHASARFGGEAALPLHYYRVLRARGLPVWLITHARVRDELAVLFPADVGTRIRFIEDGAFHRAMWRVGRVLPQRLGYMSLGFASRLATQWAQRRLARALVREQGIDVVHQPMPVSPREPSLLFGLGAPVVIGPMNGAMQWPPAFRAREPRGTAALIGLGRWLSRTLNWLLPGKRRAARLLAANARTRSALPAQAERVELLVENGVDLALWSAIAAPAITGEATRFAFVGRLVDWKAVDLLLDAFARARREVPMSLLIVGDGNEAPRLREQAAALAVQATRADQPGAVFFAGWQPQSEAARLLATQQVLVLPSLLECGGAVVLEAMALGLPVIATDWGGPADYLDPSCGVLVAPASRTALVDGLAQAMLRLAREPALRHAMGQAGRAKVRRQFDWERKVDRMLDIYAEAATAAR